VQRASALGVTAGTAAPPIVGDVLRAQGTPLDEHARGFMESRFSHDFSRVRVHTDAKAAASARAVDALAYTVGDAIVFGENQYSPRSETGRRLIAHELAHVVQQSEASPAVPGPLVVSDSASAEEREADRAAAAVTTGAEPAAISTATPGVARQAQPAPPAQPPAAAQHVGPACSGGANDPCQSARCGAQQLTTARGDFTRAVGLVNAAIQAVAASPLAASTARALDWYFNDHGPATIQAVSARLSCIRSCLQDTLTNSRFGCDPDDDADLAYVCVGATPICTDAQANVCLAPAHFGTGDLTRAETVIHECGHRVGLSLGSPRSVPDIYEHESRFVNLDTNESLRNSDSMALFVGAIRDGVPVSVAVPVVGAGGGVAATPGRSTTWHARFYLGAELQHPVLHIFNPTLGLGLSVTGQPTTAGAPSTPSISSVASLLAGVRIADPRPGASGGLYVSLFGGPGLSLGSGKIGAEAGVGLGYRWRFLDVSATAGYTYDPGREAGLEHTVTGTINLTFIPRVLNP
jgi:hypothetical protein